MNSTVSSAETTELPAAAPGRWPGQPRPESGLAGTDPARRVHVGDPLHNRIVEFLEDEATLLDDAELMAWMGLMAGDIRYRMPVRTTRDRADGTEFPGGMYHFDENAMTLMMKTTRLAMTESAWAEKPPSRTRRFVTNIRVYRAEVDGEYRVASSVLLVRNRYDDPNLELVSARRADVLREVDGGFKIAERTIYADQATIGTQNLAIFL